MRTYETIFIIHPDTTGDAYTGVVEKFRGILTDQGGNVLKVDDWGVRKLAYPVKKQSRGGYVLMAYELTPEAVAEFERRLRIDDNIMKFQTVYLEKGLEVPAPEKATAEGAAAEASAEGKGAEEVETE